MAGVGELNVKLGLDAAEFTRGLTRAERDADKFSRNMASLGTKIGVGIGLGLTVGLAAAVTGIKHFTTSLDDLDEASQALGVSAVALAGFRRAAEESGVSAAKFDTAITKLNTTLADAAGGGKKSIATFKALGIEIRNSSGQLKTTEELLGDVANKFQGYRDGAEKSAIAVALFGRAGAAMIPFLNQGSEGLKRLTGVTTEGIEAARKLQAQFDALKGGLTDLGTSIAVSLMPFLTKMIEEMVAAHRAAGGLLGALFLLGKQSAETLADPGQKINELSTKIAALREEASKPFPTGIVDALTGGRRTDQEINADLAALEKEKKFLQELQRTRALTNAGTNFSNEGRGALISAPVVPKGTSEKLKKNKEDIDENTRAFARYIEQLASGLEKEEKLSKVQEVTRAIEQNRFGVLIPQQQEVLLFLAKQIDAQEEYNDRIKENARLQNAVNEENERFQKSIDDLTGRGRTRQDLQALRDLDDALKMGTISLEEFKVAQDKLAGFDKELEKTNDAAQELGLTFSSALEDAIVDFNSIRDVVKGLEQDLLRLGTRKLVTEPLANWATEFFKGFGSGGGGSGFGSILGAIFGGGQNLSGVFASGTDFVPRDGLAYLHRGERVFTAEQNRSGAISNVNMTFVLPPNGVSRETQNQIAQRASQAIRASQRNA